MAFKLLNDKDEPIKKDGRDCLGSNYTKVVKVVNTEKRLLEIIASDETRDREGDVISQKGWNLENYKRNPVFLWAHNYASVPLATAVKIHRRRDPSSLVLTHRFPTEGLNPFADMILNLYNEKIINAGSVGFIPYDWEEMEKDESTPAHQQMGRMFKTAELLEHSGCAVPSNPAALQLAIKSTNMSNENKELLWKAVTSNEYIIFDEKKALDAKFELEEIVDKGIEEIDDIGIVYQVPEKIENKEIDLEKEEKEETEVDSNIDKDEDSSYNKEEKNKEKDKVNVNINFESTKDESPTEIQDLRYIIMQNDLSVEELLENLETKLCPKEKSIVEEIEKEFFSTFDKFINEFVGDTFEDEVKEFRQKFYLLFKAGAVLNANNKRRLQEAHDNIRGVLSDAGVSMEENDGEGSVADPVETPKEDQRSTGNKPSVYDIALEQDDSVGKENVTSKLNSKTRKQYAKSLSDIAKVMREIQSKL